MHSSDYIIATVFVSSFMAIVILWHVYHMLDGNDDLDMSLTASSMV